MENSKFYGSPTRRDWKLTKMVLDPDVHPTTFNPGDLVPVFTYLDCLPGEEYEIGLDFLVRSLTPMVPVLDKAFLDVRAFFVPSRTQWEKFENFMGSNPGGFWVDSNTYTKPMIKAGANGFLPGSVADHMRLPTKVANIEADALAFRAYVDIYNNFYRSTDVNSPGARPLYSTTDTSPASLGDPVTEAYKGGAMFKVTRLPDYFSTGTPQPIRSNSPVYLTLPNVPVIGVDPNKPGTGPLFLTKAADGTALGTDSLLANITSGTGDRMTAVSDAPTSDSYRLQLHLEAQTSQLGISVDDLRRATQYYRLLQRDLYGSRFKNLILAHFGANLPDSTVQIPQYIGGRRYALNQQQVAQTSATGSGTPLGNMGAYSLTISGNARKWRVACPEWGMILILACVRVKHSYQEGLSKMWTRKTRLNYFWPEFSQLGAFPTYKKEIKATGVSGSGATDDTVFNYQEAWDDYRTILSGPSGNMRSNVSGSLDIYHYADYYGASVPSFGASWLNEGDAEIKRTLAVQTGDLFFGKFVTSITKTTPVPMFSTGSMMDHF